jgi:LysM repeat protein
MLKQMLWMSLVMNSIVMGLPPKRDVPQSGETAENVADLRKNVNNLTVDMQRLSREVEILKSQSNSPPENQRIQVENFIKETCEGVANAFNEKINALSHAFLQKIDDLSEKNSRALSAVIAAVDANRKVVEATTPMGKQPEGIIHEVKAGETLDGIAAQFKTTKDGIKKLNFIPDENCLSVGLMLFIPQTQHASSGK